MIAWKKELIVGYALYYSGFFILFKYIDSLVNVAGFILLSIGMLFLGRVTK